MTKKINIEGMKCEGCVNRIKNVLSNIKGIKTFSISLEEKELIVDLKNESVIDTIITSINNLGFVATQK